MLIIQKYLIIWSNIKVARIQRCSRNVGFFLLWRHQTTKALISLWNPFSLFANAKKAGIIMTQL